MNDYNEIKIKLKDFKTNEIINGLVVIRDGMAVSTFSDNKLAKELYKGQKALGKKVEYKKGVLIERFKHKNKEEITEIIKAELEHEKVNYEI